MSEQELDYSEVIEYLSDRVGEDVTVSSYPTFSTGESAGPTLLGLRLSGLALAGVDAVKPYEDQWLDGRAGTRIRLTGLQEWAQNLPEDGLVLTREWFTGAILDEGRSRLRIFVFANPDAEPFYPPVGDEQDPDENRTTYLHDLVGWGFAFDFDGSPPIVGRWAETDESSPKRSPRAVPVLSQDLESAR